MSEVHLDTELLNEVTYSLWSISCTLVFWKVQQEEAGQRRASDVSHHEHRLYSNSIWRVGA